MNTSLPREPVSRPGEPTDAPPGSSRKIRVLMERAARREPLFHPSDNLKRQPIGVDDDTDSYDLEPVLDAALDDECLEDELEEVDLAG